jgi:hypothetical protein
MHTPWPEITPDHELKSILPDNVHTNRKLPLPSYSLIPDITPSNFKHSRCEEVARFALNMYNLNF